MQRILALSLCLVVVAGCGSFQFSMFGIDLDDFDGNELSADEKAGTILLIALAVGIGVAGLAVTAGG